MREVDRLVESVVEGLPPGGLLAIVADHGMVTAEPDEAVDIDDCPQLLDGVAAIGGKVRPAARARSANTRVGLAWLSTHIDERRGVCSLKWRTSEVGVSCVSCLSAFIILVGF